MPRPGLLLLLVGLVLLGTAWVFSTPPGGAPDEPAQYLRALGISEGQLLGPREPLGRPDIENLGAGGLRTAQQAWIDHDRRGVAVPASLSPPGEPCIGTAVTSGCAEVTYTGDYYPLAYFLPAAGIAVSHSWEAALFASRVGSLVQALIFLVLAVIMTGPKPGWRLVGLLAATTPMVLFVGSVTNPNGLEIAANLAFVAALLRLRRDPAGFPGWAWISLVASGAVCVLAWQLGPLFVAADLVIWATLMGVDGLRALYSTHGSQVLGTGATMFVAIALFVAWGGAAGVLHSSLTFASLSSGLRGGLSQAESALVGAVGNFGALNVPLPRAMIRLWWLAVIVLIGVAIWLGTRQERIALVLAAVLGLAFPVAFFALSYRLSGFGVQGRYILPVLAVAPMLAGEVFEGARDSLSELRVASLWRACLVAFAVFQLAAWWVNARHYALSGLLSGPGLWSPPLGWRFWLVVAGIGAAAVALAAAAPPSSSSFWRQGRGRIGAVKLRAE